MTNIVIDKKFLSQRSEEVDIKLERVSLNTIILELKNTLRELGDKAVALSAPQIGYPKRVFVINFKGTLKTFINPLINKCINGYAAVESCISIPDKEFLVVRGNNIEFFYQTPLVKDEGGKLSGYSAQLFQQMVDMLDGVMIDDYGIEMTEEIKNQTPEERREMIEAYTLFLDEQKKNLRCEIKEELQDILKEDIG